MDLQEILNNHNEDLHYQDILQRIRNFRTVILSENQNVDRVYTYMSNMLAVTVRLTFTDIEDKYIFCPNIYYWYSYKLRDNGDIRFIPSEDDNSLVVTNMPGFGTFEQEYMVVDL